VHTQYVNLKGTANKIETELILAKLLPEER
jgi:hypothetical protein